MPGIAHTNEILYMLAISFYVVEKPASSVLILIHQSQTRRKIKYYFGGELKHRLLQELLGDEFECEKEIVWTGKSGIKIIGHADAVYKDGAVVEIKTTESTKVLKAPYEHHIKQLKNYMAILGAPYGKLFYMILGYPKVKDFFPEYSVFFDYRAEKEEILRELEEKAGELQKGIDLRDPSVVDHIAKDPVYMRYGRNWMCADCPYEQKCTEMRSDAGEFAVQTVKALRS